MRLLAGTVTLLLGSTVAVPAPVRGATGPTLQWKAQIKPVAVPDATVTGLTLTPSLVLLQRGSRSPTLTVLDRTSGSELWSRPAVHRVFQNVQADFRGVLLTFTRTGNSGQIEALDERSGRRLWHALLPAPPRGGSSLELVGMVGGAVVLVRHQGTGVHAEFRELATGAPINLRTEPGRETWRRATAMAPLQAPLTVSFQPYLLDTRAGTLRRVPLPGVFGSGSRSASPSEQQHYSAATSFFRVGERLIALFDTDDDGAGHAQWPKYVASTTLQGKAAWRFPRQFTSTGHGVTSAGQIQQILHPEETRMLVVRDADGRMSGIRLEDGKRLWQKHLRDMRLIDLVPARHGCFLLAETKDEPKGKPSTVSLARVDAGTGRVEWLMRLPKASRLVAGEGNLYVLAGDQMLAFGTPEGSSKRR